MADKYARTNFFRQNLIDGQMENDLPFNDWNNFKFKRPVRYYTIQERDVSRPDLIALKFYGNMGYWWIIMKLNNIDDIYNDITTGKSIRLPHQKDIEEFYLKTRRK
jgi:hypothetical protein